MFIYKNTKNRKQRLTVGTEFPCLPAIGADAVIFLAESLNAGLPESPAR